MRNLTAHICAPSQQHLVTSLAAVRSCPLLLQGCRRWQLRATRDCGWIGEASATRQLPCHKLQGVATDLMRTLAREMTEEGGGELLQASFCTQRDHWRPQW